MNRDTLKVKHYGFLFRLCGISLRQSRQKVDETVHPVLMYAGYENDCASLVITSVFHVSINNYYNLASRKCTSVQIREDCGGPGQIQNVGFILYIV